jgi:asparagine synthase (glutamine-hydrolysing)
VCGLCGVLAPADRARIDRVGEMTRTLAHRGPDDSGTWTGSASVGGQRYELGLGHTRLSILDLSPAGHQPMSTADGALTTVYNGEIYNFRALRDELSKGGATFGSECDTEVLLQAYRAWGEDAFARLNGMFACAIWDARRARLVLVRDRMGIKPLYYRFVDGVLSFASELQALRAHGSLSPEIDRRALALFVRHGFVPAPRTIYREARKLMPGTYLVWEDGRISEGRFWNLTEPGPAHPPQRFGAAVDALEELLGDAVQMRLVSDVPLGAFLSGGIDSSTVVALMRQRASGPVRTFSIGFRVPGRDEAPAARAVAKHLGTDHTELYVDTEQALAAAHELPRIFDEPFADDSAIPTVLLSRLTREHVTVALSGDGGDELFGGYWQYPKLQKLLRLQPLPRSLRGGLSRLGALLPGGSLRNGLMHLAAPSSAHLAYGLTSGCRHATLAALCGPDVGDPHEVYLDAYRSAVVEDDVRRAMAADASVYLPDDILTKVDRASMAVALEARVPILDYRVVRFAFSLPLDFIWHDGRAKAPLRALLHRFVPAELVERPKQGFGIPIATLLAQELTEWRRFYLEPRRLSEVGLLDPLGVKRVLDEARHRSGRHGEVAMLWRLICFERWFALHHRGEAS